MFQFVGHTVNYNQQTNTLDEENAIWKPLNVVEPMAASSITSQHCHFYDDTGHSSFISSRIVQLIEFSSYTSCTCMELLYCYLLLTCGA